MSERALLQALGKQPNLRHPSCAAFVDGLRAHALATALVVDLRGVKALAADRPANEIVSLISAYLGEVTKAILAGGGTIQRYLGDGVEAIFGDGGDESAGAVPAVRVLEAIRKAFEDRNREAAGRGAPVLGFSAGIHTGPDPTEEAMRLESLAKGFGTAQVDALLSEATARRLPAGKWDVEAFGPAYRLI